ncbi:MAG: alcohol dehydrogenase catalytic domain-containing protein, partial [Pseudomonadales bacterium]
MKAWQMKQLGDPWDKLTIAEVDLPPVQGNLCRLQVEATDLSFADILQCQGVYQVKQEPPFTPGMNAVGTVLEAGPDASCEVGQRIVGFAASGHGSYAEECLVAGDRVTPVPDGVDPIKAAAMHVTYAT